MRLKVVLPTRGLLEEDVTKIVADARDGQFCLLPRHVDFVAPLVAGILAYEVVAGQERYLGLDEGVLVKVGDDVLVSTGQGVGGAALDELERRVDEEFRQVDEHERKALSVTAKLEAGLVRRFLDVQGQDMG